MLLILVAAGCDSKSKFQGSHWDAQQKLRDGDSDSAIRLARSGYEAQWKSDTVSAWKFRVLNALALNRQGKSEESLALLANPPANLPKELLAETDLAKSYSLCSLQRTSEAADLLEHASGLVGDSVTLRSQVDYARGSCIAAADPIRAAAYFQSAANEAHGIDNYVEARALVYLGYLLMHDRRYDQAIERFASALTVAHSPLLRQMALGNLGECYAELGDWKSAAAFSQSAEELASGVKDAERDRAIWLIDLGHVHSSQLEYSAAATALSKALSTAKELNDPDLQARCLINLVVLALTTNDRSAAEHYIAENEALNPAGEQRLHLLLNKAELAKLNGNGATAEAMLKEVSSSSKNPHLVWRAKSDLASLYVSQSRFAEAERQFREAITVAENAFSQVTRDEFRITFLDQEPFYDQYVHFLVKQNRIVDALAIAERGRSRALANGLHSSNRGLDSEVNVRTIQRKLRGRGQVVFAYWLGWKTESYLWVITASEIKLFKLPPENEIVALVDAYSQEVLDIGAAQDSGLGEQLYKMLVAPAERYVAKGAQVIIVPHRRLYKLNFETLVAPQPKPHFWIEDVCIQNASFLAVLEHPSQSRPHYAKDLLLMGAPVQASKDFPGLEHAPEEIEKVAAHFPSAKETVIDGRAATPAAYTSSDPREYRFFHFVTHGTASDANPLDSAIILSPSSDGYKLYARDIIKTRINPELVTISTCYGAGTRQYSGEGLVGLAWAFMRVGAHQVVAALWEVDDAANADLMDQFYSELTHGKTAATALRDGKLAMLHSQSVRKRPYYWASLQLYTGP